MFDLFQVDAFTSIPFQGNPAGVCLLEKNMPDEWMQQIAREMNLSETAFLLQKPDHFQLRWFTPKTEVSLCGHATLASAHILWEEKLVDRTNEILFKTKSGILRAHNVNGLIELDFPARQIEAVDDNIELNSALGIQPTFSGKYSTPDGCLYLLEVESDKIIKELSPEYRRLLISDIRAIIITSISSDKKFDFVSRFFAPAVGIDEDPVTGSAHCYLTPYWAIKLNKKILIGYQASARSGIIKCRLIGNRVFLGGDAVTVFKANIAVY